MCNHNFFHENGYSVCTICGEAENSHYWHNDKIHEAINRIKPIQIGKYQTNDKWKKLIRTNKKYTVNKSPYLTEEILEILNQLPLSSEVKGNLYSYLMRKKFKYLNEVWKNFYKLICINDLPITTTEFLKILQNGKRYKVKPFKKLQKVENGRKYYWYITKQLNKAQKILGFSPEEARKIYKIVFNYYNLIRFKMLKSSNPIHLIQNLVYYTVREKLQPNQQHFSKRNFEIINYSYTNSLVKYLKEIKDLKLDSCFIEKLEISKRNKRLIAKLN